MIANDRSAVDVERDVPDPAHRPLSDVLDDRLIWALVDAAPDGIVLVDDAGRILLVNRQTEELFGYDRGEFLGRSVDELLPERFQAVHRAHRTRYRAEPRSRPMGAGSRLFGLRRDGTEFPVEISLSPVQSAGGTLAVAVVRDVSDRVATEARFRDILESLDATRDAVGIFDPQSLRYTYVNQGFVDQVGYPRDQLVEMTMLHFSPELDEAGLRDLLTPMSDPTSSATFTTVHRRRDGRDLPVEIVVQPIVGDDGHARAFVQIARDITDRIETEALRRQTEQELLMLEDRERMARDLHDLVIQRLFAAGMSAQALLARLNDPELAVRARTIVDELDETIREIRTVIFGLQSPLVADRPELRDEVLAIIDQERPALGLAPHVRFDGAIETVDAAVQRHLLAILREALSNAARHAHATSVTVEIALIDDRIVLRVSDDGIGLTLDSPHGNGLRNMSSRAAATGGTLEVRPGQDGGTVLECRLPITPPVA